MGRVSRLHRGRLTLSRLQERGGEGRRRERKEIEANEEHLVKSTADEQDSL